MRTKKRVLRTVLFKGNVSTYSMVAPYHTFKSHTVYETVSFDGTWHRQTQCSNYCIAVEEHFDAALCAILQEVEILKNTCQLCLREVNKITKHHLIPKTRHKNKKAKKDYAKSKAEGRDPITLTKYYAGKAKQVVRPKRSIYYQKKKGFGSKLKGLFGKKKKGIYE